MKEDLQEYNKKIKLEPRGVTRRHMLNIVFQLEFYEKEQIQEILDKYYEILEYEEEIELKQDEYFTLYKINKKIIENQILSLLENFENIDDLIQKNAIKWDLNRLDKVDLAILRLAIFELMFQDDIPNRVVINEAIEIAKEYGSEKSSKFINGILAGVEKGI